MEILVFINKVMVIMVILLTTITMVDTKITSKDLTAFSFRLFRKGIELFLGSSKKTLLVKPTYKDLFICT